MQNMCQCKINVIKHIAIRVSHSAFMQVSRLHGFYITQIYGITGWYVLMYCIHQAMHGTTYKQFISL